MPTTVNSRFLAIAARQPNINTGWTIKVLDYKDMTSLVAVISNYTTFSFTMQLNNTGTGSITLDEDDPWWDTTMANGLTHHSLKNNEYVFEAWEDGVPRFAWLAQTVENKIVGEDETHQVTISGPGIAGALTWACIMRPGWPKTPPQDGHRTTPSGKPLLLAYSYSDKLPAFFWQFPIKWPSMRMWTTVFLAAQRRGLLGFVKCQFSALHDSAAQPWKYVRTVQTIVDNHGYQPEELGENLLDFLNDCTGQDYSKWFGQRLEWIMYPGFKLFVKPRIGVDRSKTVRFFTGQLISNERNRDREQIYNRVTAVDVDGSESIRLDKTSVAAWNLREQRNDTNKNISDPTLRNELADRYLEQAKDEKSEWNIKVPYDDTGRVPFHDFTVGDTVGFSDTGTGASTINNYRVLAITVAVQSDSVIPDVELTLQSIIDAKMIELEKQITRIVNEPKNFNLDDLKDIAIPAKPDVKSGLIYNPDTGKWQALPITEFGGGTTDAIHVYIQDTDPATVTGNDVSAGDFWFDTGGVI